MLIYVWKNNAKKGENMKKRNCAFPKLDGKITEIFGTRGNFADALKISQNSMCSKMNGKRKWKAREIVKACELLSIPKEEIAIYFFS